MIAAKKIKFRNQESSEFNVLTDLAFDSDNGEIETYLNRTGVASETYNGAFKRVYGYKWDDVLAPTITFIKDDYSDFTPEENERILDWLTGAESAEFMDVYKEGENCSAEFAYCLLGNFVEVNQYKITNDRVIGYVAKFECVTPWAFSELKTEEATLKAFNTYTIQNITDKTYPKITIKILSGGEGVTLTIKNNIYNQSTLRNTEITSEIVNCYNSETLTIDCANKVISSNQNTGRIIGDDFNWEWLFLNKGTNEITVSLDCNITIQYRLPIKRGDL